MGGAEVSIGWSRAFDLSWIIGFCGGSLVYYTLCLISPPPGAPYVSEYLDAYPGANASDGDVISGVPQVTDVETGKGSLSEKN